MQLDFMCALNQEILFCFPIIGLKFLCVSALIFLQLLKVMIIVVLRQIRKAGSDDTEPR